MLGAIGWAMPGSTGSFRSPLLCLSMLGQGLDFPSKRQPLEHAGHTRHGSAAPLPRARRKTKAFPARGTGAARSPPDPRPLPVLHALVQDQEFLTQSSGQNYCEIQLQSFPGSKEAPPCCRLPSPPPFLPAAGAAWAPRPSCKRAACSARAAVPQKRRKSGKGPMSPEGSRQPLLASCLFSLMPTYIF